MVRIRLKRVGKAKQPSYRVVVADSRSPRDGRNIESIGHYQPRQDPSVVVIDNDRAVYWLRRGAQPSEQVRKLLRISGAWSLFTGEEAPAPASRPARATAAASVTVARGEDAPVELPEAEDQQGAAPEAETEATGEDG